MLDRVEATDERKTPSRAPRPARRVEIGDQTIIVGDCAEALALMPPESVDVVVTSPPYNIGAQIPLL